MNKKDLSERDICSKFIGVPEWMAGHASAAITHYTGSADAKQSDDSIGETFVSIDAASLR
jgi:hypothetical protein